MICLDYFMIELEVIVLEMIRLGRVRYDWVRSYCVRKDRVTNDSKPCLI